MNESLRQLRGRLRNLHDRRLIGWAFVEGEDGPATVDVYVNQRRVATGPANLARPNVQARGLHPTGECGFDIPIPEDVKLADGDLLELVVEGAEGALHRSPAWIRVGQDGALTIEPLPITERTPNEEPDKPSIPVFGILPVRSRWQIVHDVMRALVLREIRNRYGAFRFGYFWAVAQPVMMIAIIQLVRSGIRGRGDGEIHGVNSYYFFQLGVIPWFMFAHGYHQAIGAMRGSKGMYSYRQIQPIDVIVTRCVIEFVLMVITFVIFLCAYEWLGWSVELYDPLAFLCMIALLFILTVSLGVIADVMVMRNEETRRVIALFDRPLFFISGVFFTLEAMPESLHPYLMWNPLLHAMELGRASMLEHYTTPCSWSYLSAWTAILFMFALGLYRQDLYRVSS